MKKIKRWAIIVTASLLLCACSITLLAGENLVSPAMGIIATDLRLAKSSTVGHEINFTAEDFDSALGVNRVSSVTIVSLPEAGAGKLMLGSLEVMKNQTIKRNNLGKLRFVPTSSSNPSEASFMFRAGSIVKYDVACSLYILGEMNYAPTVSIVHENVLDVHTAKNVTIYSSMKANDPENDELTYEIVTYPKKGVLTLCDKNHGSYSYTPCTDYVGKDSFVYTVYDKYGNKSDNVKVSVTVEKNKASLSFSDMKGHWADYFAIKAVSDGIMSAVDTADGQAFMPDAEVSRIDFLVMAMKAAGYDVSPVSSSTGFVDDDEIPSAYKGYVLTAYQKGIVGGIDCANGQAFMPDKTITRAEAAVILNKLINSRTPAVKPVFADSSSIPTWAADAMYALCDLGIIDGTGSGYLDPGSAITRAQAAKMLVETAKVL